MDQSAGMLSEDVQEKGYCLLCVAMPQTDCEIEVIEEARAGSVLVTRGGLSHEVVCHEHARRRSSSTR